MSKGAHRYKPQKKKAKPQIKKPLLPANKQRIKQIVVFAIVAILAAIPFGLGKYLEFNTPGPFDSGIYVYSAKHILDGAEIGVEERPSAQLGTLLVNILGVSLFGFSETGPELIQMILQAVALVLMFIAMYKLFGTLSAAVGVIVASFYLSCPLIAKFGNVKEQYMIAFMIMGASCFVMRQLDGKWWWAVLAGAFVSWAPLFKQTGTTVIGAIGLFVVIQPILKNRSWKQTGTDILLLLAGVAAAIGPLYIWIIGWDIQLGLPYAFAWNIIAKMLPAAQDPAGKAAAASGYIARSRTLIPFSKQWPTVLRFYGLLILPIALAIGAVAARVMRMFLQWLGTPQDEGKKSYERFVLLFAAWWVLDMAFVWISPRSYDQYYLPLNASAAMLGGYLVALYSDYLKSSVNKSRPVLIGLMGLVCMVALSQHIFFGIKKSPYSAANYGEKRRGYVQALDRVSKRRKTNSKGYWEIAGEYIRTHSEPADRIYVWGWMPGIYVSAQRFSAASKACSMPRPAPPVMVRMVAGLLAEFKQKMPMFIVDSRKNHVPLERPPYELWPALGGKTPHFIRPKAEALAYDKMRRDWLAKNFDEDEALRYEALQPFRQFVMDNYRIVEPRHFAATRNGQLRHRMFGNHVLFQLKNPPAEKETQ